MSQLKGLINSLKRDPKGTPSLVAWRIGRIGARKSILDGSLLVPAEMEKKLAGRIKLPAFPSRLGHDTAALGEFYAAYPEARTNIIDAAGQILSGRTSVFGHTLRLGRWHEDEINGARWDPEAAFDQPAVEGSGDIKVPWELGRFQFGPKLAQAWRLTGDDRFAAKFTELVRDWHDANPLGRGIGWNCPMEVAIRALNWLAAYSMLKDAAAVSDGFTGFLGGRLLEHAKFIQRWMEPPIGNHYLSDLLGLICVGSSMVVPETVSISRLAASRLPSELNRQINKDGSFGEASSFYGRLVLEGFALAAACTDSHTDSRAWRGRLASGAAALKNLTRTDGSMAQLGDNDSGRYLPLGDHPVLGARGVIAIIAAMLDDSELAPPAGDWWEDAVWMYGSDALELMKQGRERDGDSITSLNEAGWYTANLGEAHLTVSCGPVGLSGIGAHAHNDKLSFELFAGEPLIVDPGTYCYTLDPEFRNAFRSTRAHSTLMLDGAEQVPFTDQVFELPDLTRAKCGIFERRDERVVFQGSHRGYQQRFGVKHIRRISLGRHELSIEDRLEGGGKHDVKIGFPLAPGLTVEIDGSQAIIQGSRISARLNAPGALTVEDAEYSPGYLQREKCLRVVYRDQVSLPCSIETSISWSAD